jgi:hypothetical protein
MGKNNNTTEAGEFVNPFAPGVSLKEFETALAGKSVKEYLADQMKSEIDSFTDEDVKWIESEIKKAAYNEKNRDEFLRIANEEHRALVMNNNKKVN